MPLCQIQLVILAVAADAAKAAVVFASAAHTLALCKTSSAVRAYSTMPAI
jgi:hypothetical protein